MTGFRQLLQLGRTENTATAHIPDDWLQGRSTFGGLSAALCLQAVLENHGDLPPLRSAQVSFIGPSAGDVHISSDLLRQGRNVTFIRSTLSGEAGPATTCTFCFGQSRDSQATRHEITPPDCPLPEECPPLFPPGYGPVFTQHLEQRLARGRRPLQGPGPAENFVWARLNDWGEAPAAPSVLAVADALPPAEMSAFTAPAPISTMTWMVNFLTDSLQTEDGWWLIRAHADHTANGYSSQDMTGWNYAGEAVWTARQSIAVFA